MEYLDNPINLEQLSKLKSEYGNYIKLTVDLENSRLVAGCELHADGEEILLPKGSNHQNIWGGGINFKRKEIDTFAVLNLRPNQNNDSMEILDPSKRNQFITIVKEIFNVLWN